MQLANSGYILTPPQPYSDIPTPVPTPPASIHSAEEAEPPAAEPLSVHDLLGAIREDGVSRRSRRSELDAQLALSRRLLEQARALGDGVRPLLPPQGAASAPEEPRAFSSLGMQQELRPQLEPEAEPPVAALLEPVLPIGQTLLEDARAWPEPVLPSHLKRRNVSSASSWSSPPAANDCTSIASSVPPSPPPTPPTERTA